MGDENALDTRTIEVPATFQCVLRVFDRKKFQEEGRMVFGLSKKTEGTSPDIRRQWEGDLLYDLRLMHGDTQVHRVMSDSEEEVTRLMREAIPLEFWAYLHQSQIQASVYQDFLRIQAEESKLGKFIHLNYQAENAAGKHERFTSLSEMLIFYLSKERNRFRVRIGKWIRRGK